MGPAQTPQHATNMDDSPLLRPLPPLPPGQMDLRRPHQQRLPTQTLLNQDPPAPDSHRHDLTRSPCPDPPLGHPAPQTATPTAEPAHPAPPQDTTRPAPNLRGLPTARQPAATIPPRAGTMAARYPQSHHQTTDRLHGTTRHPGQQRQLAPAPTRPPPTAITTHGNTPAPHTEHPHAPRACLSRARERPARTVLRKRWAQQCAHRYPTPTNPPGRGNERCGSSPHPGTRNGSCPRSPGYPRTSGPAATGYPPRNTDGRSTLDSPPGTRLPARPRQPPERRCGDRPGRPTQIPRVHRQPKVQQVDNASVRGAARKGGPYRDQTWKGAGLTLSCGRLTRCIWTWPRWSWEVPVWGVTVQCDERYVQLMSR